MSEKPSLNDFIAKLAEMEEDDVPDIKLLTEAGAHILEIGGYKLVQTTCACPEQYDVFKGDELTAYFRLRGGLFTARVPDVNGLLVYEKTIGAGIWEGSFANSEQAIKELTLALEQVTRHMEGNFFVEPLPEDLHKKVEELNHPSVTRFEVEPVAQGTWGVTCHVHTQDFNVIKDIEEKLPGVPLFIDFTPGYYDNLPMALDSFDPEQQKDY